MLQISTRRAAQHTLISGLHTCDRNDMHICVRTTVDIPDHLLERVKPHLLKKGLTLRSVVVDALERLMRPNETAFRMRDASVGYCAEPREGVNASQVNAAVQELNE